jgi:hypothetical protein
MLEMNTAEDVQNYLEFVFIELRKPFHESLVKWFVPDRNNRDSKTNPINKVILAYVDARDVQERLDEVVGPQGWSTEIKAVGGHTVCNLYLHLPFWKEEQVTWEWVVKSDVAGPTEVDPIKGAGSTAFKRAASAWGIGRYLYDLGTTIVPAVRTDDGYDFNPPELPEFARPTAHSKAEVERVKRVNRNLEQLRRKVEVPVPPVLTSGPVTFTEKQVLATKFSDKDCPNVNPIFHGKTIGEVIKLVNDEAYVINYLAGTGTAKNGDTFTPSTEVEKDIQQKALSYKNSKKL